MPNPQPEIIEAQIVEDANTTNAKRTVLQGEVSSFSARQPVQANARPAWHTPGDHARPQGDRGGLLSGFWVLAIGFVVTVCVLVFSVCIMIPFALLMRLLRVHKRR